MTTGSTNAALTVNDMLSRRPETAAVLHRLGLDTCCGGSLSLAEAARSVGMPLPQLLAALQPDAG